MNVNEIVEKAERIRAEKLRDERAKRNKEIDAILKDPASFGFRWTLGSCDFRPGSQFCLATNVREQLLAGDVIETKTASVTRMFVNPQDLLTVDGEVKIFIEFKIGDKLFQEELFQMVSRRVFAWKRLT